MKNFEKLWQEYFKSEPAGAPRSDEHRAALRKAFFTGAWCHMTFAKKILGLRGPLSDELIKDLEWELAHEVTSPFRRARPAAPPAESQAQLATDSFPV